MGDGDGAEGAKETAIVDEANFPDDTDIVDDIDGDNEEYITIRARDERDKERKRRKRHNHSKWQAEVIAANRETRADGSNGMDAVCSAWSAYAIGVAMVSFDEIRACVGVGEKETDGVYIADVEDDLNYRAGTTTRIVQKA